MGPKGTHKKGKIQTSSGNTKGHNKETRTTTFKEMSKDLILYSSITLEGKYYRNIERN